MYQPLGLLRKTRASLQKKGIFSSLQIIEGSLLTSAHSLRAGPVSDHHRGESVSSRPRHRIDGDFECWNVPDSIPFCNPPLVCCIKYLTQHNLLLISICRANNRGVACKLTHCVKGWSCGASGAFASLGLPPNIESACLIHSIPANREEDILYQNCNAFIYLSGEGICVIEPSLTAVQVLGQRPVYRVRDLFGPAGSRATAYRLLRKLQELGFASETRKRGHFVLRSSVFQPYSLWPHLLPSLRALKEARYFGRAYDGSDVNHARRLLMGSVTLDYRAYELTRFQTPRTFFIYVEDPEGQAKMLRLAGFSEGRKGRVAILPRADGDFEHEIQRLYLDCLAFGGRSTLDAIAIELLYGDELSIRGVFPTDLVIKVREDLPRES